VKTKKVLILSDEEDDKPVLEAFRLKKIVKMSKPQKKTETSITSKQKQNMKLWKPKLPVTVPDPPKVILMKKKSLDELQQPLPPNLADMLDADLGKIGGILLDDAKSAVEAARGVADQQTSIPSPHLDSSVDFKNTLVLDNTASQVDAVIDDGNAFIDLDEHNFTPIMEKDVDEAIEKLSVNGEAHLDRLVPAAEKRKRKIPKRFVSSLSEVAAPDAVEYNVVRINDYRKGAGPYEPLFVQVVWDNILEDGSNEMTWESVENCVNCTSLVADFAKKVGLKVSYFPKAVKDMTVFRTSDGGCFSTRHDLEPEVIKEMFPDFRGI
jgi:hypothetical protein